MRLTVKTSIDYTDEINGNLGSDNNGFKFNFQYDGDSNTTVPSPLPTDEVVKDFQVNCVERKVFELDDSNTFDKRVITDILDGAALEEATGVYIYCYESTPGQNVALPVKFNVTVNTNSFLLGSMSEYHMGNLKDLNSDIKINGITVPTGKKANLVFILTANK